jgi:DNA-binding GntR family transcriptional regulator
MRIRSELSARLTNLRPIPTSGQELYEQIVATLRPAILGGELPQGIRLIEEEIGEKFGVSRGPVREALLLLEQEGLVTMQPRRGATVVGVTERDIRELYDLRLLLETHAAELAASNARPEDIDYLTSLSERLYDRARGEQLDALSPVDILFHRHLFVMANQQRLRAAWERLAGILEALLTITDSSRPHDVRHRYIVQALEEGNPEKAKDAIRTHISRAQIIMLDVLRRAVRQRGDAGTRLPRREGELSGAAASGTMTSRPARSSGSTRLTRAASARPA